MTKRAIIYARVSTDSQRENYSIPTQLSVCRKYGQQHGYAFVGDSFVDPITGLDTTERPDAVPAYVDDYTSRELSRPGLNRALAFLEKVGGDVMLVLAVDRLARDPYIRETLEREVAGLGAKVEYAQGNYEDSPEGEVRKDMEATFAKWENAKRVERCMRGKLRKAESGLVAAGRPPYGYTIDKTAFGGLAVIEAKAKVVQWIFDLYVNHGESIRGIVKLLNEKNIPAAKGGRWTKASVALMLKNEVYAGRTYYNRRKRSSGRPVNWRDPEEWIAIEVSPLIDRNVFNIAKKRLSQNKADRRRKPDRFYTLGGMIHCIRCGKPFSSGTKPAGKHRRLNDAPHYRHRKGASHCSNCMVSARRLEAKVWEQIKHILLDPERLRMGYLSSLAQQNESKQRLQSHLEVTKKAHKKAEEKLNNLTAAYIDPDISMDKEEYVTQKCLIKDEIKDLITRARAIEDQLASQPTPAQWQDLETFIVQVQSTIRGELPDQAKRKIYEMLHLEVYLTPEGELYHLEGWFNLSPEQEDESGSGNGGGSPVTGYCPQSD